MCFGFVCNRQSNIKVLTEAIWRVVCEDLATHVDTHFAAATVVVQPHGPDHGWHRAADHNLETQVVTELEEVLVVVVVAVNVNL